MKSIIHSFYKYIYLLVFVIILCALFLPRKVSNAVVINNNGNLCSLYIDGKQKSIKVEKPFKPLSVINFKYNLFKNYDFEEVIPITERVMKKSSNSYDLESSGESKLSSKIYYYKVVNNVPVVSDKNNLIIGKNNIRLYKDSHSNIDTVLIFPMDYSKIRVGISTSEFSSIYHTNLNLKLLQQAYIYDFVEPFFLIADKDSEIKITLENKQINLYINGSKRTLNSRIYIKCDKTQFTNVKRGFPSFTPIYNGVLEISSNGNGLIVINELDLEEYLYKVVPSEMPASSSLEALKCQAIAARTYAISDMLINRYANLGFYVDDSTQSQVFNNTLPQPKSTEAVNLTKGMVLLYNNKLIDAKYYSTSCGIGANYEDIWFKSDGTSEVKPYLKATSYLFSLSLPSTEDEWLKFYKDINIKAIDSSSSYYRWFAEFTKKELENSIKNSIKTIYDKRKDFIVLYLGSKKVSYLPNFTDLISIEVNKRGFGGNIIEICYVFKNGKIIVRGDTNIRSSLRCTKAYAGKDIPIIKFTGDAITGSTSLPSSFFSIEENKDNFIIYGGGYGHGVGMSQFGAMELAKKGEDYESILNTYYKNINIVKLKDFPL
ncbi:MAG: lytB [Clostridiaceae bacterium]|jgi:SpoIID/LytB domain protein|nr:lytB [Clostridiaceae bacterium]